MLKNIIVISLKIGGDLASNIPASSAEYSSYLSNSSMNFFILFPCETEEIITIVNLFESKVSFRHDLIPMCVIKNCITYLAEPLCVLVNCSFRT